MFNVPEEIFIETSGVVSLQDAFNSGLVSLDKQDIIWRVENGVDSEIFFSKNDRIVVDMEALKDSIKNS